MLTYTRFAVCTLSLLGLVAFIGCARSDDRPQAKSLDNGKEAADPHDHPITEADVQMPANYTEAVARIKQYRDAIREGANSETPGTAHRPLDEADIVLRKLPAIARDSGVPAEELETVNLSARELRDLFNKVHAAIDEKRPPDFAAVADPIELAIVRLEAVATKEGG